MIRVNVHKYETYHHVRQDGEIEPVDSVVLPRGSRAQVAATVHPNLNNLGENGKKKFSRATDQDSSKIIKSLITQQPPTIIL